MRNRYEILVVDLDGTLLRSDGSVSQSDRQALRDAADEGLEVILATGRAARECTQIIEQIEFDGPMITAGGAVLCDARTGTTNRRVALCHTVADDVVERLLENDHKALILKDAHITGYDYLAVGDAALHPASAWWFRAMDVRVREHKAVDEHPHDSLRVGAVATEQDLAPIASGLMEQLADRCRIQHWSAVTATESVGSSIHLLEVFHPQVDKWSMLQLYCEDRSLAADAVVAIGDGLNDVELIEGAALGIAMENADPRVLDVADRVTGHHNRDGVAEAVRAVLTGKW